MTKVYRKTVSSILPLLIFFVWYVWSENNYLPPSLLPSPKEVSVAFLALVYSGELLNHSAASIGRLFLGFGFGAIAGFCLGLAIGMKKSVENLVAPTLQFLAPIPPIVWIPLLIAIFGIGELSKILLLAVASFFVVCTHTMEGVRSTDLKLVDVANILNKNARSNALNLFIPASFPHVFLGLKLALGLSWILLIAAEVIASSEGLGWLVWDARSFSRPDDMFVGIITIGLLGKTSEYVIDASGFRVTHWSETFGRAIE